MEQTKQEIIQEAIDFANTKCRYGADISDFIGFLYEYIDKEN